MLFTDGVVLYHRKHEQSMTADTQGLIKGHLHYIRKLIFDGWCKLIKIPTKMNTADMATKILPASSVSIFSKIVLGLPDTLQCATDTENSAMLT